MEILIRTSRQPSLLGTRHITTFNTCYIFFSIFRIVLFIFTTAVMIHGRQVEIASSLDFLWKQQAKKELEEMSEMRRHTNQLLQNILPIHVAKYFLEQDRQAEVNRSFF